MNNSYPESIGKESFMVHCSLVVCHLQRLRRACEGSVSLKKIFEFRVLLQERELHGSNRPVTLF